MIKIDFVEPATPEWIDWRSRCKTATDELVKQWQPGFKLAFNSKLYSEMKAVMLEQFHGKCAYCEAKIETDQHGDVEHFRPKGAVTNDNHTPVILTDGSGNTYSHPGYFWLAYDWRNLLPSCVLCNQPSSNDGNKLGKRNRFPVHPKDQNAAEPTALAAEKPFLLNPMFDDPAPHFRFDPDTGRLVGLTDEGKMCVEVFNLNDREGIMEARRDVYDSVLTRARDAFQAREEDNAIKLNRQLDFIRRHKRGEAEYSVAGRTAIAKHIAAISAHLMGI